MVDVRNVFASFYLVVAVRRGRPRRCVRRWPGAPTARARLWRRLSRTGVVIVVVTVVGGTLGVLFFEQAFELFHTLFFPAGSYTFDSGTERLVQLFPYQFWVEVTIGVGVVVVGLSLLLAWVGRRRAAAAEARA